MRSGRVREKKCERMLEGRGNYYMLDIGFAYINTEGMLEAYPNRDGEIRKLGALEANQLLEALLNKSKEELLNKALGMSKICFMYSLKIMN